MIRRVWDFLSSTELTLYLIFIAIILFVTGALYNSLNFALFLPMNEMRLQDWIREFLMARPDSTWWLPLLLAALALLGINTALCTIRRVAALWPSRKTLGAKTFFHRLTPSLIHCFFLVIMTGHLVTLTMGTWQRIPFKKGGTVTIDKDLPPLTIEALEHSFYPPESFLNRRISGTTVSLRDTDGKKFSLSYLTFLPYGRYHIHLDMIKVRKKDMLKKTTKPITLLQVQDNCNKASVYHMIEQEENKKLMLLVISDPGLPLIIAGFTGILFLMIWYFSVLYNKKFQL